MFCSCCCNGIPPLTSGAKSLDVPSVPQGAPSVTDPEEKACCQSLPNNKGEIVYILFDSSANADILRLRKNDNTITKVFTYGAGMVEVTPPATEEIFWLNDNRFACVSSGRKKSYYAIYEIAREEPGNTQHSTIVNQLAEGYFCFFVSWRTESGAVR